MSKRIRLLTAVWLLLALLAPVASTSARTVAPDPSAVDAATNLFFSEYVETSVGNNKAYEIYNGTGASVSLTGYTVELYTNGSPTAGSTLALSTTLANNDVFVVAHTQAFSITALGLADATTTSTTSFNGDDALVLKHNGTIIDVIGQVGTDPGTEWGTGDASTVDNTIRRKAAICAGDTVTNDSFDPATEWDGFPNFTYDGLGSHSANCGTPPPTPPTVSSHTPIVNATNVSTAANITITFSEAVTVASGWYSVVCTTSGNHTSMINVSSADNTTYTLDPQMNFSAGENCTVTINAAQVTDGESTAMAANYSWSFTVAAQDNAPTVVATSPGNVQTGVALDSTIVVTFSEAVTVQPGWITLNCSVSGALTPTTYGTTDNIVWTVTPDNDFAYGDDCYAYVHGTQVSDIDGAATQMEGEYSWIFIAVQDLAPTVVSTTPANGATGVATNSSIVVAFSEPVNVSNFLSDPWLTVSCTSSGAHTMSGVVSTSSTTYTVSVTPGFQFGETCTATVKSGNVTDQDGTTHPMAADYSWSFTINNGSCPAPSPLTIGQVQGTGTTSSMVGQTVTVTGVVSVDKQATTELDGFFIQSEGVGDGNPATSDGIFVFHRTTAVNVGDRVQVTGGVSEFQDQTQISSSVSVTICATGVAAPAPKQLNLPFASLAAMEAHEGMMVTIPETLTIGQNFFLGRYGQMTVSAEGRVYHQNTDQNPDPLANALRMFVIDDGRFSANGTPTPNNQNPSPIPYMGAGGNGAALVRGGNLISGVTGVWTEGQINSDPNIWGYIVHPTAPISITEVHPRPAAPEALAGNPNLKVGSYNVLNYFTTIDQSGASCAPSGTRSDCRGADSAAEFTRQQTKIVTAMVALDADVFGLMEIQNNGTTAVSNLANAINAVKGAGTYATITAPAPGSDAIKVELIYKPGSVTPLGPARNYQVTHPDYGNLFDRPPLAQTFTHNATGDVFTVVVNHFKSKNCGTGTPEDEDQGDGAGCFNAKRTAQAEELLNFIADIQDDTGDNDILVIGDLNAYSLEDPIVTLTDAGLVNEVAKHTDPAKRYSYVFDGAVGYLDHALASQALDSKVTDVIEWHINADEASVIDYNLEFKPDDRYQPNAYRSSDHDPVLVGLSMGDADIELTKSANRETAEVGEQITYTIMITNSGSASASYMLTDTLHADLEFVSGTGGVSANGQNVTASGTLNPGQSVTLTITVEVIGEGATTIANTAQLTFGGTQRTSNTVNVVVPEVGPAHQVFLPIIRR